MSVGFPTSRNERVKGDLNFVFASADSKEMCSEASCSFLPELPPVLLKNTCLRKGNGMCFLVNASATQICVVAEVQCYEYELCTNQYMVLCLGLKH